MQQLKQLKSNDNMNSMIVHLFFHECEMWTNKSQNNGIIERSKRESQTYEVVDRNEDTSLCIDCPIFIEYNTITYGITSLSRL